MSGSNHEALAQEWLAPDEPAAFRIINAEGKSHAVLVCDHASNLVPRRLGTLGLGAGELADHIAWDPGAAEVAQRLAAHLDAPLVLSGYSRLVIDCNRPLDSPESIPMQSAGVAVPGNLELTLEEREARVNALFWPYHRAITRLLDQRADRPSLLLSIHSFTPCLDGHARPWSIGVSYGRDRRLAALMRHELLRRGDLLLVGDNEPYAIEDAHDYTIPVHGENRGLRHVLIEIRQNGIRTPAEAATWAARLAEAYGAIEVMWPDAPISGSAGYRQYLAASGMLKYKEKEEPV
ncbi:MAG: N-formylglutamate amidohydrolase [Pseudomonadota bacterium]